MRKKSTRSVALFFVILTFLPLSISAFPPPAAATTTNSLKNILSYISNGWDALTRSMSECETFSDPKTGEKSTLYLPADLPVSSGLKAVAAKCKIRVNRLPGVIKQLGAINVHSLQPQGLLYLPEPYVVPGGMFNEMYGWDSYFIIRGLIDDGRLALARDIVGNFFFEIDHYGGILNANRTYYLTRSQPPFLTSMIRAVYEAEKASGQVDHAWLARGYNYAVKDYRFWTSPPHMAGVTGLSRYYGFGEGPVPELDGRATEYYQQVARYFLLHPSDSQPYLMEVGQSGAHAKVMGPEFSLVIGDGAPQKGKESIAKLVLTPKFYKGDRSMRESGFDVSFRFGPFGAGTPDFAAVGLNSLLYKTEKDLEWMSSELRLKKASEQWQKRALERRAEMDRYLWNPQLGFYYDYAFKDARRSLYTYATTFYPLWVGLATPAQAQAVVENLKAFEQPGGIVMSMKDTGAQWDYPYGWAPIQLIAIEGLRRYGYQAEANRISLEFLSMVLDNFRLDGTIREKYNVVARSAETQIHVGYKTNVVGFGWTNGVFLALLRGLPKEMRARLNQQ
jgi:alpha,alpha-trehalase